MRSLYRHRLVLTLTGPILIALGLPLFVPFAATYKAYTAYAAEHKGEVPSAAAVRKFYGSWNSALAAVE